MDIYEVATNTQANNEGMEVAVKTQGESHQAERRRFADDSPDSDEPSIFSEG
jgi:hypothetical protein